MKSQTNYRKIATLLLPYVTAFSAAVLISCAGFTRMFGRDIKPEGTILAVAQIRGYAPDSLSGIVYVAHKPMKGLHIKGEINGLFPRNTYALHIHSIGNCSSRDDVGELFNPGNSTTHGDPGLSPGETQAGTLPNITADNKGTVTIDHVTNSLGVGQSGFSIMGRSIVIHASPDNFSTFPEGNAGEIIACGVFNRYIKN